MFPSGIWYTEWDVIIATADFTNTATFFLLVSETKQVMTKEKYTYFNSRMNFMRDYIPCFGPNTKPTDPRKFIPKPIPHGSSI